MSRIGKKPIPIPKGVEVTVAGQLVKVKGPKGSLEGSICRGLSLEIKEGEVCVVAENNPDLSAVHGLQRALLNNMVDGVTRGFTRRLEMVGVGYRAAVRGHQLELLLGFSHPTEIAIPTGLHVLVEKNTSIHISGIDRQQVGQFAANIRSYRPPEPYKGKGIRYEGETVRRKAGKASK